MISKQHLQRGEGLFIFFFFLGGGRCALTMDSSLGSKIASKLYSLDALQKGKLYLKSKTVLPIYLFGPGCCKQRSSLFQQYLAAVKQRRKLYYVHQFT